MTRRTVLITLARGLAGLVLFVGVPVTVAAAATHQMLNGTDWTEPEIEPRPAAKPAPQPAKSAPAPRLPDANDPWKIGDCVTQNSRVAPCRSGMMRVVGRIYHPKQRPCAGLPETARVQHVGEYALCLTPH